MSLRRNQRRNQRGHAMLELAVCAGVMVACLSGTFQFGYTFFVYNQLVNAVGNGGRYASLRPRTADEQADKTAIRNMVLFGESRPSPNAVPVVRNLKPEQVEIEFLEDAVRVGVREFQVDAVFADFTLTGKPVVEFPLLGGTR